MISEILALSTRSWLFSDVMTYVVLAVYILIFSLAIICLIRASRYFRNAGKEQKLIKMELGKIAEEVHLLRQEMKDIKNCNSST